MSENEPPVVRWSDRELKPASLREEAKMPQEFKSWEAEFEAGVVPGLDRRKPAAIANLGYSTLKRGVA